MKHLPVTLLSLLLAAGCDRLDMYDQPRYEALEVSDFFADGRSARPQVEGTIARGALREDEPFYTGKEGGQLVHQIPAAAYRASSNVWPSTASVTCSATTTSASPRPT